MNYFQRKDIVRLLAEKPDMMSDFPEHVLSPGLREQMTGIPGIALCDIAMLHDHAALEDMCAVHKPDALLPAIVYTGVDRMRLSDCESRLTELKKTLGRFLHVHLLPPVVLGAPAFRSALCLYAASQSRQHICCALVCAACIFYRVAVCIPLCKQCGITRIWQAGLAPCCAEACAPIQAVPFRKYCSILPAGYGITLDVTAFAPAGVDSILDDGSAAEGLFDCCARLRGPASESSGILGEEILQRYFETFAIPLAANVISTLLSGRQVDFPAAACSFLPADKKK